MTVSDYITSTASAAKDFLISTDYSVEMIGQAVGYTNLSSFSRVFKGAGRMQPNPVPEEACGLGLVLQRMSQFANPGINLADSVAECILFLNPAAFPQNRSG